MWRGQLYGIISIGREMKRENKKRTSEPCKNSLALLKHLMITLREIVQFFDLNYNYFYGDSIASGINVYENKPWRANWRASHTII